MIVGQPRKTFTEEFNRGELLRELEAIHKRINEVFTVGDIILDRTLTPATETGAKIINKLAGTVRFAAAATTLVVTNSFVDKNSIIFGVIQTNDATAIIKNIVPGTGTAEGTFTIRLNAAATAETVVAWFVLN